MPNPDKEKGEEDKRQAIALQVPGADPPTLEKEEVGVPEKRKWWEEACLLVRVLARQGDMRSMWGLVGWLMREFDRSIE